MSIGAIVLGYFTRDSYTARNVVAYLFGVLWGFAAAGLAGYVAARSARRTELRHGFVLTGVIALIAIASPPSHSGVVGWYVWVGFLIAASGASVGALLRARQQARSKAVPTTWS